VAQVAVGPEKNTKRINTVWAERTVVECLYLCFDPSEYGP